MYKFHYQTMLPKYEKINLCFTDTDSLLYEIFTDDVYADMAENASDYDFSEYPFDHPLYSDNNKKVIGKFKDELNSCVLEEFIGVLPKFYSLLFNGNVINNIKKNEDANEEQKAKGSVKGVRKRFLTHQSYKEVHECLSTIHLKQNVIRSNKHTLGTYNQTRSALSAFDIKRWICMDNIHTMAYGHIGTIFENP